MMWQSGNDVLRSGRRAFIAGVVGLVAAPLAAEAQQTGKVGRVGYLLGATRQQTSHLVRAFEDGLRDLGYVPGRNVVIEYRFADGKPERLPQLAQDLVRLKVDVIVAPSSVYTGVAKQATSTTPIIFVSHADPIGSGHVFQRLCSLPERSALRNSRCRTNCLRCLGRNSMWMPGAS